MRIGITTNGMNKLNVHRPQSLFTGTLFECVKNLNKDFENIEVVYFENFSLPAMRFEAFEKFKSNIDKHFQYQYWLMNTKRKGVFKEKYDLTNLGFDFHDMVLTAQEQAIKYRNIDILENEFRIREIGIMRMSSEKIKELFEKNNFTNESKPKSYPGPNDNFFIVKRE